jgi:hypothetical protein
MRGVRIKLFSNKPYKTYLCCALYRRLTILKLSTFLLLLLMILQAGQINFILFEYKINKKAFAKNCINKAKPQLQCQGKCQMRKKIKEEQEQESHSFANQKTDFTFITPIVSSEIPSFKLSDTKTNWGNFTSNLHPSLSLRSIFHPPRVC